MALQLFDYLTYYLVKAFASMLLTMTAKFFGQLHRLQILILAQNNCSFSLVKPGWTPLLKTMYLTFNSIQRVKNRYVIFDDEF